MSFRASALSAAGVLLTLASLSPVSAQPAVPVRPRYSAFNSIFAPGTPPFVVPVPGLGGLGFNRGPVFGNALGVGGLGAGGLGFGGLGVGGLGVGGLGLGGLGFPGLGIYPGMTLGYPGGIPTTYLPSLLPGTGIPATFGNYGHWYSPRSGYYGHWYPNGVSSGAGVLGLGYTSLGLAGGFYAGPSGTGRLGALAAPGRIGGGPVGGPGMAGGGPGGPIRR